MKQIKPLFFLVILLFNATLLVAEDEMHTLNFQDADIRLLIETVSDMTKKNFIVDPQVQGKVTVISGHPMSKEAVYDTFLGVLSVYGYAAVRDGDSIKVVPEGEAGGIIGDFGAASDSDYVTRIVKLKHVAASDIVTMFNSINRKAKIISHDGSNIIIISDRAKNVERMLGIINRIDKKSDSSIDMIPLQYASAADVSATLETLLDNGKASLNGRAKIVADERTNSVIINASPAMKMKIHTLIAQLDQPLETNTQSQVIKLKYSEAESLVPILQTLINKQQALNADGSAAENNTSIQAHVETNSLVINAPPTVFKNLREAIRQLDVKRPQVLVEAIIVEITVNHSKEAGFQWQGLLNQLNGGEGLIGGTNYGIVGNILNPEGGINNGVNIGYVHLDGEGNPQLGALLSALAANTDSNILSTPSIVTLNNKEAKLSVGQEVPFLTGQYTNTGSAEGSTNPFSTIQRKDIGISLTVTPHIYEGNEIVLDIAQEVSSLAQSATTVDVITNKRTLSTSVMVPNDGVIVLGGLIDDSIEENIKKVPVLGDIPVIRNLFRHKKRTRVKRNLMVFIHPKILTANNQSKVTNKMYDDIRTQQLEKVNQSDFAKGTIVLPENINQNQDKR